MPPPNPRASPDPGIILDLALDQASSLLRDSQDAIDAANVEFLRLPFDFPQNLDAQNAHAETERQSEQASALLESDWRGTSRDWRGENSRLLEQRLREMRDEAQQRRLLSYRDRERDRQLERDRRQRLLERLRRYDPNEIVPSPYGDRVPGQQSLYDWAPHTTQDARESGAEEEHDLGELIGELRRQQPSQHPEVLRVQAQSQLQVQRVARRSSQLQSYYRPYLPSQSAAESSLRSTAIYQSIRRHPRFSRTRESLEAMQRYLDARERGNDEGRERSRGLARLLGSDRPIEQGNADYATPESANTYRERLLPRPIAHGTADTSTSKFVDLSKFGQAIEYLSMLRFYNLFEDEEKPYNATEAGQSPGAAYLSKVRRNSMKELICRQPGGSDDIVLDINDIRLTAKSSWLAPDTKFAGDQDSHRECPPSISSTRTGNTLYQQWENEQWSIAPRVHDMTPTDYNSIFLPPNATFTASPQPMTRRVTTVTDSPSKWPVTFTIHSVDYASMTLTGTMEAFDVPLSADADVPCPPPGKGITTFVEGEIIDFHNHSLLTDTPHFRSSLSVDAAYWSRLEPFRSYFLAHAEDDDGGKNKHASSVLTGTSGVMEAKVLKYLLTTRFWEEEMRKKYVLMRWKEKCFVKNLEHHNNWPLSSFHSSASATSAPSSSLDRNGDGVDDGPKIDPTSTSSGTSSTTRCPPSSINGLTISGFYYVSMRRSDGKIEALYHDEQSTPYQHLVLDPVRRDKWIFPAIGFR